MGEPVEGAADADPFLGRGVGDAEHGDDPAVVEVAPSSRKLSLRSIAQIMSSTSADAALTKRGELLGSVGEVPMGLRHQLRHTLRRLGGLGHGFLLPDALDGSHGSRSSERGRPTP